MCIQVMIFDQKNQDYPLGASPGYFLAGLNFGHYESFFRQIGSNFCVVTGDNLTDNWAPKFG